MSDVEFLVKLRDAAQIIADVANKQPEKLALPEWDPKKVAWTEVQGTKGPYQRADPQATPDFKAMLSDLKEHGGKLTRPRVLLLGLQRPSNSRTQT